MAADSVMTVLGPVGAESLGTTLIHEHLLANLYRVSGDPNHLLNDPNLAATEVKSYRDVGGRTIVDCTSIGLGRDPRQLKQIAEATGVQIVMGCAWYRQSYYPPGLERRSVDELAAEIVAETRNGAEGTTVRPGVIGEVGCDLDYVSPLEERILRAACRAQLETGLLLITHAARSNVGLSQLEIITDEGVDLTRVAIGHCDTNPDPEYHRAIAERGAFVCFDTIRGDWEWDTQQRIQWVLDLRDGGLLSQVLLSHDVCMRSHLAAYGGNGYAYIPNRFLRLLADAGLAADEASMLLTSNPRRALTGSNVATATLSG